MANIKKDILKEMQEGLENAVDSVEEKVNVQIDEIESEKANPEEVAENVQSCDSTKCEKLKDDKLSDTYLLDKLLDSFKSKENPSERVLVCIEHLKAIQTELEREVLDIEVVDSEIIE